MIWLYYQGAVLVWIYHIIMLKFLKLHTIKYIVYVAYKKNVYGILINNQLIKLLYIKQESNSYKLLFG